MVRPRTQKGPRPGRDEERIILVAGVATATAAFFDLPVLPIGMQGLRDALRDLPESVFADLLESDDAYLIVLDLPGVTADTADLRVERGRLVVEARRAKDVPAEFHYVDEDRSLFVDAELPLPPDATGAGASAAADNGVFEIQIPKREATPRETIPISSAGDDA